MSGGPALSFAEYLVVSQVDGTAFTSSVAGSIIPPAAKFTLPSNFFSQIGKMLKIKARGRLSCSATPGTLAFNFMLGANNVFGSGAFTLASVLKTNVTWAYEGHVICRSIGTAATLLGIGNFECEAAGPGTANVASGIMLPLTAPAVGATFDSTATQAMDLQAVFGTNAVNSITTHHYAVESCN
jgi:hypothetical protein